MNRDVRGSQAAVDRRTFLKLTGAVGTGLWASALAPRAVQAAREVKVGILGPITHFTGQDIRRAADMAAEEINAAGGMAGRKVVLAYGDSEGKSEGAIRAIQKLVNSDRVEAIVGGFRSGAILAIMPYIARYRIPFIGTGAASPDLTRQVADNYGKFKYFFRVYPINAARQAMNLAAVCNDTLSEGMGWKRYAIDGENFKWAHDYAGTLQKELTQTYGLNLVYQTFHDPDTQDFTPIFTAAADKKAQVLLQIISNEAGFTIVKQWHDQKAPFALAGNNNPSYLSDFWEKTDGKAEYELSAYVRAPLSDKTLPFWDRFEQRYGATPFYTGMGAYDSMHVLKIAADNAGSLNADKLVKALEQTNYRGVIGHIVFDDRHDVRWGKAFVPYPYGQWLKGKKVAIWPKQFSLGAYQPPPWL